MAGSDEPIGTHDLLHSPGGYDPAQGLITLARIIARVHIARLANKAQTVTDNRHSNDRINDKANHEDIP